MKLLAIFLSVTAYGQECRITSVSPAQPEPRIEDGENALESETFQTSVFALSPNDIPYFVDSVNRIRRIDPDGRVRTVAGNSFRADVARAGPALETPLPPVTQLAFSPSGVLHFASAGRVLRVVDGMIEVVAGTAQPGFNGEAGPATEINLGNLVSIAFQPSGSLLVIDGFARVRRVDPDGTLRTVAGCARPAASGGFTGDNGPAAEASLSSPRQVVAFADGSFWIKDLSGRHLRLVAADGIIRTLNPNFESSVNILMMPDGTPAAGTSNRVYLLRPNGAFETGVNPFAPFTGTPRGVASDGSLFYQGSTRPEQSNPLIRMTGRQQTVIAGAPVAATVDGQAPPYGIWNPRTKSLFYSASQGGKAGILEVQAGQAPRFVAGGGADIGDAEGKTATSLNLFGLTMFTVDNEGRIVILDANRRRILVVGQDGKVSVLRTQGGEPVLYAPLGGLSNWQRITVDNAGNIYWFSRGATPTGGVFTADIAVWRRDTSSLSAFTVAGLYALTRLEDGSAAVLAGNSANFRSLYRISPEGLGEPQPDYLMLPFQSVAQIQGEPYFTTSGGRLFRGGADRRRFFDLQRLPSGTAWSPDFVAATPSHVMVHMADGGFYRIENIDSCKWLPQPRLAPGSVVNAANPEFVDTISPRQLITVYGSGLGPPEGQGYVLDGLLRATGQPAPYPNVTMGNFSGSIPNATLSGNALPVVYSNSSQMTLQVRTDRPSSGQFLLYFNWQGLYLIYPNRIRVQAATPGLFTAEGSGDGLAMALNEDGTRHSASNPARPGSLVHLYGTGFGAISTNLPLGEFYRADPRVSVTQPVAVWIGDRPAAVEFAGGAPDTLGVIEVRVRVPEDLPEGQHPVRVQVGEEAGSSQKVTLNVR